MSRKISVLITAAGNSQRMGNHKALLKYNDNQTFLEKIIERYIQIDCDEIVITAYKASLPLKLSAKMVNIILPKQIERSPVKSIEDLLNYHSGVDVLQRGPHGVQADITLRGGSFDKIVGQRS